MRILLACAPTLLVLLIPAAQAAAPAPVPAGMVDVLTLLPQADAATDYTTVINQALSRGQTLFFRRRALPYRFTPPIVFGAGSGLVGEPGTVLAAYGTDRKPIFTVPAPAHDASIRNITFDGTHAPQYPAFCGASGFRMTGGGMTHTNAIELNPGCDGAVIRDGRFLWASSVAIAISGGNHDSVLHNQIEAPSVFAVDAGSGSGFFRVSGNWTTTYTGAEFFAAFVASHDGEVSDNVSVHAGDNGMSFSGSNIRVTGNRIDRALAASIAIYGDRNTIEGNRLTDGGQVLNPAARPLVFWDGGTKAIYHSPGFSTGPQPALNLVGAFGGYAQSNRISNNVVDDNQPVPTQAGMYVGAGQALWSAGRYSRNSYVYVNGSTYKATATGVSIVPPSGRADIAGAPGMAGWTWISSPVLKTRDPAMNRIGPNTILRTASYRYRNSVAESENVFVGRHD